MIGTGEAAKILGCSRDKVSKMCRENVFKTAEQDRVGTPWRIDEKEVRELAGKNMNVKKHKV